MALTVNTFIDNPLFDGEPFIDYDDEYISGYLDLAKALLPADMFCGSNAEAERDQALTLYLAHLLILNIPGKSSAGNRGQVSSVSVSQGSQSLSFSGVDGKTEENQLNSTRWGIQYQAYIKRVACGFSTGFVV